MSDIEKINIQFDAYRDKDGNPTCAIDFSDGKVCFFYATKSFGTKDVCYLTGHILLRRNNGFLQPCKDCLIWSKSNEPPNT